LDLQVLISSNSNVRAPYKTLGLCYYYQRSYPLANEAYAFYLEENDKDYEAWFQKGLCNFYYADFENAIKEFSQVLQINPNYISALDWRAQAYQKANYIKNACKDWKEAVELGYSSSQEFLDKYCFEEN
ncbi:MAG: tetratricopeptide repeat protein, partial [Bacteroidetes bacterium]|nr:tetratricopeptide repeat protein [Bacteroidota bacterium]